jgi:hypothetical protein
VQHFQEKIMNISLRASPLLLALAFSAQANASLIPRAGGTMLYDDDRNITWLADANYAKTSGYDADGLMNWNDALSWAANLNYGGYGDWRLPKTLVPDLSCTSHSGAFGLCRGSELGHLYYVERVGDFTSNEYDLFKNLAISVRYWSSDIAGVFNSVTAAYQFEWAVEGGSQFVAGIDSNLRAWVVRDGDVVDNNVPEPGSVALIGVAALAGLYIRREIFLSYKKAC